MDRKDRLSDGERDVLREIEADARDIADDFDGEPDEPHSEVIYGFFPGGDPRKFTPDFEACSEQEIANWKAACQIWNDTIARGKTPTPEAGSTTWRIEADGFRHHTLMPRFGIGTYTYP